MSEASEAIVRKVKSRAVESEAGIGLQPEQKRQVVLNVEVESLDRMRKKATVTVEHPRGSTFEIICDEGPYLGGDDSAPPPLAYFCAGVAFCLMTQLSRYAAIAKLKLKKATLRQTTRFFMEGSFLTGTIQGGALGVETLVDIESDEPVEKIRELVAIADRSCFASQSMVQPVPTRVRVTLNGEELPGEG